MWRPTRNLRGEDLLSDTPEKRSAFLLTHCYEPRIAFSFPGFFLARDDIKIPLTEAIKLC